MTTTTTTARSTRQATARRVLAFALGTSLVLGAAACGEDAGAASGDATCGAFTRLSGLEAEAPRDPEAVAGFARDTALPIVRTLAADLPDALRDEGATLEHAYRAVAERGDLEAIVQPAVDEAKAAVGAHLNDTCDGRDVTVDAVDYGFAGLPEKLPAGAVNVRFRNTGAEEHEMLVLRRNDGETGTLAELTADPEQLMGKVRMVGVVYGAPEAVRYARYELEKGTYFFICMVPTKGVESDPHLNHGMHRQVTVS